VTHDEVLRDVRGYSEAGRIVLTKHARRRMLERGAMYADVRYALLTAVGCSDGDEPNKWIIESADRDGDAMTLVVVLEAGVIVVTLHE
jgi:hypothetical protein